MTAIAKYELRNVFWGRNLPKARVYDENWVLINEWDFAKIDGLTFEIRVERSLDKESKMENGEIRQRIRGYRVFFDLTIINVKNREMLVFLRDMWLGSHVVFIPHYGTMQNPASEDYAFEIVPDSEFNPTYINSKWIGHSIVCTFKTKKLLPEIPRDVGLVQVILATEKREGGTTSADPITSKTFWGEKMFWGGWEVSQEDLRSVAFWEQPENPDEIDQYGKLW